MTYEQWLSEATRLFANKTCGETLGTHARQSLSAAWRSGQTPEQIAEEAYADWLKAREPDQQRPDA